MSAHLCLLHYLKCCQHKCSCLQAEEAERLAAEAAEKLALEQAATDPNVWAIRAMINGAPGF